MESPRPVGRTGAGRDVRRRDTEHEPAGRCGRTSRVLVPEFRGPPIEGHGHDAGFGLVAAVVEFDLIDVPIRLDVDNAREDVVELSREPLQEILGELVRQVVEGRLIVRGRGRTAYRRRVAEIDPLESVGRVGIVVRGQITVAAAFPEEYTDDSDVQECRRLRGCEYRDSGVIQLRKLATILWPTLNATASRANPNVW